MSIQALQNALYIIFKQEANKYSEYNIDGPVKLHTSLTDMYDIPQQHSLNKKPVIMQTQTPTRRQQTELIGGQLLALNFSAETRIH